MSLFPIEPYLSGACMHRNPSVRLSGLLHARKLCYSFIFKQLYCVFRSSYPACDFDLQPKKHSCSAPQFFPRPLKNRPHLDSSSEIPPHRNPLAPMNAPTSRLKSHNFRALSLTNNPHSTLCTIIKMSMARPTLRNFHPIYSANNPIGVSLLAGQC